LRRIVGVLARRGFNEGASLRVAKAALEARCAELENE
ncbi:TPA: recombination regulator RecX, partial [Corynebacterium striatum]|nr:recombination regulator RecX [Corynebacterium striatum]